MLDLSARVRFPGRFKPLYDMKIYVSESECFLCQYVCIYVYISCLVPIVQALLSSRIDGVVC